MNNPPDNVREALERMNSRGYNDHNHPDICTLLDYMNEIIPKPKEFVIQGKLTAEEAKALKLRADEYIADISLGKALTQKLAAMVKQEGE